MSNINKVRELLAKMVYRPIQANTTSFESIQSLFQKRGEK
jgi:hypothetical protein